MGVNSGPDLGIDSLCNAVTNKKVRLVPFYKDILVKYILGYCFIFWGKIKLFKLKEEKEEGLLWGLLPVCV